MPYKSEKIKIEGTDFDRRRKFTDATKNKVRQIYFSHPDGYISQRELARRFGISRRMISFILFPQKLADYQKYRRDTHYSQEYYKRYTKGRKWAETIREHRHYKNELSKKGLI